VAPVTLAISAGDPRGIGPEIVVKALGDPRVRAAARYRVHADAEWMRREAARAGVLQRWLEQTIAQGLQGPGGGGGVREVTVVTPEEPWPTAAGEAGPSAEGGRASLASVRGAIRDVQSGAAAGLVTAPISKESWRLAGQAHPGHTELLAEAFDSPRSAMLFVGPSLRVILATIHVPLRRVPEVLTTESVERCIELGCEACRMLGVESPRLAVAGLNPHAGEAGLFGHEDERVIEPAVRRAAQRGIAVRGPLPGDTVFLRAARGEFDLVVAMYHDQGLIPVKLLDRERAVNVTVGLRLGGRAVVRTSPAHGTAFDIAGRNAADPTSMIEALLLAARMARLGATNQTPVAAPAPPTV
jgi:4-hydroxythreonine-4-phosphate dehydrogenase